MKFVKYIFILCSILLLQGCPIKPRYEVFLLENNSNNPLTVRAVFPVEGELSPMALYPDTSIALGGIPITFTIKPNSTEPPYYMPMQMKKTRSEYVFAKIDTLCVFIIHRDTSSKYNIYDLNRTYNILQRYDVSLENMEKLEWQLVYPPDERMKDIKMYPPYNGI
jgi:hypothetical protein